MAAGERIGVYGGTFDPLHNGHWRVAEATRAAFGLKHLLFVPAFVPPHKRDANISAPYHRYAMLALATAGDDGLLVSAIELEAPARPYTIETLRRLEGEFGGALLFFIMGADSFREVDLWREHERLLGEYRIIVAARPGSEEDEPLGSQLAPALQERITDLRGGQHPSPESFTEPRIYLTDYVAENISATAIRAAAAAGRRVDEQVPPSVAAYINKYRLYRA